MDPNANLKEQLKLAKRIMAGGGLDEILEDAARLAELVIALDEWIGKAGFLPDRWIIKRLP